MFRPVARAAARTASSSAFPSTVRRLPTRRWASTGADKPRSWKSGAVRWGLAGAIVYYYNTTNVFADTASQPYAQSPPSIHVADAEEQYRTLESYSKKPAPVAALSNTQTTNVPATAGNESTPIATGGAGDLEAEASQQGAFNEETGEINWDCPCLGGMAHGPCGEEFKAAFSCFVYSQEEPKGVDCIEKFKGMQDCFRAHPDIYGSELEDDEEGGVQADGEGAGAPALARDDGAPHEAAPSAKDAATPVIEDLKAKSSDAKDEAKEQVSSLKDNVEQKASSLNKQVKATVATAKNDVEKSVDSVKDNITSRTSGARNSRKERASSGNIGVKEEDMASKSESLVPKAAHDATGAKA